jgi:hypothetical protein
MKSKEVKAEKKEKLGQKLRREVLVGKSKPPSTPSLPYSSSTLLWILTPNNNNNKHYNNNNNSSVIHQDHRYQTLPTTTVSVRKLAAALWEFNHYFPLFQMHRPVNNGAAADSRLRRRHYTLHNDKAHDISNFLADGASPSSPDQVPFLFFFTLSKVV